MTVDASLLMPADLARYAAPNVNVVFVAAPHNGLGVRSAPKDTAPTKDSDVNYLAIGAKGAGGAETISRREMQRSRDNRGIGARQKAVRLAAVAARVG